MLDDIANKICLTKNFTYLEKVGQGGFKETFKVSLSNGQLRALKIFDDEKIDPQRVLRELSVMDRLSHPGIAKLHLIDKFQYDNEREFLYVLEEYLDGGTLTNLIRANGLLKIPRMLELGLQLIDIVENLAAAQLVHRDIKPDNILFRASTDEPVITDFGIVRDLADESITATYLPSGPGTPLFSSPEQLKNEKHLTDWRSDQFSLGIVLYYSAFGKHPFGEIQNGRMIPQLVARRNSTSQEFLADVTAHNLFALRRMVEPWPVKRFRTVKELKNAWEKQG